MDNLSTGICAKCHKEGNGKNYSFYYGYKYSKFWRDIHDDEIERDPLGMYTEGAVKDKIKNDFTVIHNIRGPESRFICERCAHSQKAGEVAAIKVSKTEIMKKHGRKFIFWTDEEIAKRELARIRLESPFYKLTK